MLTRSKNCLDHVTLNINNDKTVGLEYINITTDECNALLSN